MRGLRLTAARVVEVCDLAPAALGPGEVRVAMRMAGLNRRDAWIWRDPESAALPAPLVSDGVGSVVEAGPGVDRELTGEDVILNPVLSCGRCLACLSGDEPACADFRIFDGAAAEQVVVTASAVARKPPNLTDAQAAVIGLVSITAYDMVFERARVRPGERVLVWGARGGLGDMAVQMVQAAGAQAVAVARGASTSCASCTLDRTAPDFDEALAAMGPFDVVIDSVGAATFTRSLRALRRGGRLVTVGSTSGSAVQIDLDEIFGRRLAILGAEMGGRAALRHVLPLFVDGRLKAAPATVMDVDDAQSAFVRLDEGDAGGKMALRL